jgi:recombination protein RecT
MSNDIALLEQNIYGLEAAFEAVNVDRSIAFRREAEFAIQVISNNAFALGIATKNPQSVRDAVTNIASIGISLNPAKKQAYLVPRDNKICLDLSYMGLIELAVASGSIHWAKAELVREQDHFKLNGFDRPPAHQYAPFAKDRGDVIGVYVVVKTSTGDYLTDTMTIDEVNDIRNRTSAWKAWIEKQRKNPWVTDPGEMAKKTVIKRAYKTWPRTDRLDNAVHYLNNDGEGLVLSNNDVPMQATVNVEAAIKDILATTTPEAAAEAWKRHAATCNNASDMAARNKIKASLIPHLNDLHARAAKANATDVEVKA